MSNLNRETNTFKALANLHYEQRRVAHGLLKSMTDGKVSFMDLRKFHYNVLCRSELKESGAEVLEGRAKSVVRSIIYSMK